MSGIHPTRLISSCGAKVNVTSCGSVLEISCRGNPDPALANIVHALGMAVSPEPGYAAGDDPQLLWVAPNRWWLIDELRRTTGISLPRIAVTEIGDAVMRLQIHGESAREWLSNSCPVDLRAKSFGSGRLAWTLLCESRVLLHCKNDGEFDLYVDRSLCQHIVDRCSEHSGDGDA